MRDYEERAYDAKRAPGYWQLGRLGPENENTELQAKVGRPAVLMRWGYVGLDGLLPPRLHRPFGGR